MSNFESPQLFTARADGLLLSGQALLDLMSAVLSKNRPFRFKARGWSMTPFIRDGDVITVEPMKSHKVRIGEVVAFIKPDTGKLVVHRIVAFQGNSACILGDNLPDKPDGIIPLGNLLGRVTRVEREQRQVWLGLGPERFLIAWLSRVKLLLLLRTLFTSLSKRF